MLLFFYHAHSIDEIHARNSASGDTQYMQTNNYVGTTLYVSVSSSTPISAKTYYKLSLQHMRGAVLVRLNDQTEQIIRDKSSFSR